MFKTKKQKEAEKLAEEQKRKEAAERLKREQAEQKAAKEQADRKRQNHPEQVAAYKLLDAALNDAGLRWISREKQTHRFHSPALSADIYLTYIYAENHATRTDYRVRFDDSVEVYLEGSDPVGQLAERLESIGRKAGNAAYYTECARRKQVLFDLAARVKSR